MSSESREQAMQQANKQAIHCISTPNSPGQKRGGEKEFVIDHKKTKKKKREPQERRIPELQANKRCLMSDTDESSE